ncbi:hypothetical protein AAZX31_17G046500 [Glycine max]|uniref:Protein TIFY n=3 Tax=Glycine subgen. Soja TaxID=1462606 RepID=I1MS89_SOYBN|nr:CCT motif and tify domain-containing protein [Glycine max]XP_028209089.1 protein TIFY 10A-like [Glycine soja]KAG4929537.1 hypothetical protein JHK86_046498 [Glycine max]KAG4932282.1 hypothetical protein JHK87_046284 [Glycine soja]KAG4942405.1 hypothetical protein JHK85_047051 [Glycine max]KAG5096747.1 hypothetical protein JHK82_046601 [Glycine max]KAG5101539.1 hypothetical protein JHK84_046508 [Glycine max]|eukprot:NP_001237073.2 CCT motif and tify domain-containing protein [Glycine max]
MSSSSEYSAFSGPRPAKSPAEKSTFSQTCSLLSQYIKEKGAFGDLTLGMTRTPDTYGSPETSCHSATTMELFPTIIKQRNPTTVDFLSPQSAYPHHSEVPTMVKSSAFKSIEKEPKAAQLTIFYAGQVVVFDDFPAEKLEEIMSLAGKGISQSQNTSACAHTHNQQGNHPSFVPNVSPQAPSRPIVCELPIARKVSLHRFLSKRKDRIASKAPYQINNPNSASNKPAESMTWLGLGAQSTQF